jgi:L-ascorbate metabolism protein UlaG (beta-lactamase superfamily)
MKPISQVIGTAHLPSHNEQTTFFPTLTMAPLKLSITHVGTATAILEINGVNMLTDPFFSPAGTSFPITDNFALTVSEDPALRLDQLSIIDAVLLSHEDHDDNLDPLGRQLLDGRRVFTTMDGAKNLSPRPSVHGFKPWQEMEVTIAGKQFKIIATPAKHVDGQECTGFLITSSDFGTGRDGLPNAIYFSGDTVYIPELAGMASRYHVTAAILNLGNAHVAKDLNDPDGPKYQITMDGKSAARLFREIKADVLVPMHYEAWGHFTQFGEELRQVFKDEGIAEKVCWLAGGKAVEVL